MGDRKSRDLRFQFDCRLKLKLLGSKVTTCAGLLAYQELGLTEMSEEVLTDSRGGSKKQHQFVPPLRQSVYSRPAGYEDVDDAERLAIHPARRHVVGGRATLADKYAASTSEVDRFETEIFSMKDNRKKLMALSDNGSTRCTSEGRLSI
jgi:hypothetical protein